MNTLYTKSLAKIPYYKFKKVAAFVLDMQLFSAINKTKTVLTCFILNMNRAKSIYWVYTMINLDILLPHTTKKKMKFRIFVQRIIENNNQDTYKN